MRKLRRRRRVGRLNVEGDGQADLVGHGGEHRAVYVYDRSAYAHWARELGRDDLADGQFGENFTVEGMPDDEAIGLLDELKRHATQEKYQIRLKYGVGDLVIWDNTGTMHRALPYPLDSGRMMAGRVGGAPRLEHAMDAVMMLTAVATRLGDRAGLVAFDRDVRGVVTPAHTRAQLGRVTEAIRLGNIVTVPKAPSWLRGVMDLRGRVIPVVDLARRLELEAQDSAEGRQANACLPGEPALDVGHESRALLVPRLEKMDIGIKDGF